MARAGLWTTPTEGAPSERRPRHRPRSPGTSPITWLLTLGFGYSDHDPVFEQYNRKVTFERYYGPADWDSSFELDRVEHPEINQWGIVEVDVETAQERVIIPHDPCGQHFV
jgi:hypothetical protein